MKVVIIETDVTGRNGGVVSITVSCGDPLSYNPGVKAVCVPRDFLSKGCIDDIDTLMSMVEEIFSALENCKIVRS